MRRLQLRELLGVLADGGFHSGEEIGAEFGVSRSAVWKQLSRLEPLGLQIESRQGKGYRIRGGLDLLSEAAIRARLESGVACALPAIDIHLEIDSTNRELMRQARQDSATGRVCLAESQSAGRGRLGRDWVSPLADSIYLSIAWEFRSGAALLEGLSLATGVATARALSACGIEGIGLKWPNDIVADGRKLGGILIEVDGDVAGPCTVVIGIGINGSVPRSTGRRIDIPWTDLRQLRQDGPPDRNELVAGLLSELVAMLQGYETGGFATWRDEWLSLDALQGQDITVHLGKDRVSGRADGVDASGALRLRTGDGTRIFHGGEVSLKAR